MEQSSLAGKVAIVTGACSGIGLGTLKLLLSHGVKVASFDIAKTSPCEHSDAIHVECDVSKREQVETSVGTVYDKWKRIDILINCAGVLDHFAPVAAITDDDWQRCFAVNVDGPMHLMRACVPHFLSQPTGGRIVNICSTASIRGAACGAAYTASKHALLGLSRSTAWMYAKKGIQCNAILLGPTGDTNITKIEGEWDNTGFERCQPYGNCLPDVLKTEQVLPTLLYLCTAPALNGAELALDYGLSTA